MRSSENNLHNLILSSLILANSHTQKVWIPKAACKKNIEQKQKQTEPYQFTLGQVFGMHK